MINIEYDAKKRKAVVSGDKTDVELVREHFSVPNPAAKFGRGKWHMPKRLYAITPAGSMDVGMVREVLSYIDVMGGVSVTTSDAVMEQLAPTMDVEHVALLSKTLRDYQTDAINVCIQSGRGVSVLGTGAGKTLIIATLIESVFLSHPSPSTFRCLVIVPDLGLVNQTHSDFVEYGVSFDYTRWTGKIDPDMSAQVYIANTAVLQNRFDEHEWIQYVDMVVVDEAHKAGAGTELSKMLQQIHTIHKFGFTGTLPESPMNKWNIIGKIGPVLMEKNSHELRSESYLTNAKVKMLRVSYQQSVVATDSHRATQAYEDETNFIKTNTYRHKLITTVCSNFDNNVLVLVNHIDHGLALMEHLQTLTHKQVFFIRGEVEVEDRDRVKHIMETNNNVVCVAISSIFSTGVNITNIHMIMFAAGGKSFVRVVQSIGRGLRLHDSKIELLIVDVADELAYGKKHADRRRQIYKQQQIPCTEHIIVEK